MLVRSSNSKHTWGKGSRLLLKVALLSRLGLLANATKYKSNRVSSYILLSIANSKMASRISQYLDMPAPTRPAPKHFPSPSNQHYTSHSLTPEVSEASNRNRRPSQVSSRSIQSTPAPFPPPSRSDSGAEPCDVCEKTHVTTWTCIQCNNDSFCDDCWGKERAHRHGAVGFDGKPHEKTDRKVVKRLREILEPERSPEQQQELHRGDEDTTWFGIARDSANLPIFQDYERYASIMAQSRTSEVNVRYPQLVSFIGQTG